ncbi:MAG: hypothetical protein LBT86_04470 [Deltaproteobacteria bacterium]|nr:hypothetical protein [Deltaproteobacteria bacterium]
MGVNNNSQNTTSDTYSKLDLVYRNIFGNGVDGDITVQADFSLRGGGVVGVNGLSNAGVELTNLYDNVFGGIKVDVGSYLRGGGVVGAQNNDEEKHQEPDQPTTISEKSVSSKITNVVNNLFYNLEVTAGSGSGQSENKKGEISGGGVLGARTGPNAANIEYLLNNVFKDIKVTSTNGEQLSDTDTKVTGSNILGGGIVGVSSVWWAGISGVANNYFEDIDVTITGGNLTSTPTKGHIKGGGVIGLYSEGKTNTVNDGLALASVLSDNVFKGVKITTQIGGIYGGGLIGASSFLGTKSVSRFTAISKNTFGAADKKIEINTKDLYGGGVIGLYSEKGTSYADFIGSNVFTPGVINVSATNIIGGGLIGATIDKESAGIASIENLLDNGDISSQKVTTTGHLTGGGLIGAVAMGGGDASILNSYSNYFMENVITVGTYLEGGGIIGVRSGGTASIGSIVDNFFVSNKISVGAFIDGGGVIGVTGPPSSSPKLRFGLTEIRDSFFTQNTVTAGGPIAGGLIYSYGLNSPLTIDGSGFLNNTFTSTIANPSQWTGDPTAKVYGTITIDTGLDKKSSANKTNVVILKARANDSIYFNNNKLIDADGERFNSLYFGRVPILTETTTKNFKTEPDYARSDAELRIETEAGGGVILLDPIEVNQDNNNSTYPNRAFYMSVSGPGDFLWGGSNIIRTGSLTPNSTDVNNTIFLNYGSTTNLQLGMTLEAPNHLFRMVPGSNLIVTGKNVMTLQDGSFNGHLQFNLANTTINDPSTVLLTIKPTNPIDISGAVVTLTNFKPGPNLYAGDKFYLIDTGADNMLKGDTYTKTATARQGYFTVYNFIIDKVGSQDVDNGQQLVARLAPKVTPTPEPPLPPVPDPEPTPSPTPAPKPEPVIPPITPPDPTPTPDPNPSPVDPKKPVKPDVPTPQPTPEAPVDKPVTPYIPDTPINTQPEPLEPDKTPYTPTPAEESKIVLEGRVASLAVVTGIGNWLADHSYRSADMAVKENNPLFPPSSGDNTLTGWMPYAGIDAGLFWTHHGSKNKYRTLTFIAGLNRISNSISDNSSFLLSAFFDGGYSSYDVNGNFGTQLSGDGTIRYLGGGLMGRQRWNNGFRLEGSARIGRIRNEFTSSYGQANEADSPPLHYEFETPYLAFHAGLGKEFKVQENALLDVLARYFWTKQDGTSYRFSSGELVEFDSNTSQRVRVGTRYNRFSNPHLSFYIGGAYEYEFSSKVQGHFLGQPFISPDTKGSTGIVDIGVIRSPNQDSNFSIEAGLQGHFGARRGISGGVRLGYEFN